MHVYKKGKIYTDQYIFFLNIFVDHLGRDTAVGIVGITEENPTLARP